MHAEGGPIPVLLVEDDPNDVHLTRIALETVSANVDLRVVGDGTEALQYLNRDPPFERANEPALILLDFNLPRLDGREVLRLIKSTEHFLRIPVVVLTTSSDPVDVETAYRNHANSFITKPTDFEEFAEAVGAINKYWLSVVTLPE